jgi:hypothetical protein
MRHPLALEELKLLPNQRTGDIPEIRGMFFKNIVEASPHARQSARPGMLH